MGNYYPNQYRLLKSSGKRFVLSHGRCESCGDRGQHIHHVNFGRTNHKLSNLIFLCIPCHRAIHKAYREAIRVGIEKIKKEAI
jgi:5-methylcytosine-specific restriction endonuclease McrA